MKKPITVAASLLLSAVTIFGLSWHSVNAVTQTQISLDSAGDQGNGQLCGPLSVSSDGRYVAFSSSSSDLVSGDTNGLCDIFLRDTVAGTTTLESVSTSGTQANEQTTGLQMTRNARYILMTTYADNLASGAGSTPSTSVYLRDTKNNTTQLVAGSAYIGGHSYAYSGSAISEDGRFVYYTESGSSTSSDGMYVKDMLLGTTTRVDAAADGTPENVAPNGVMSADCAGRFAVFQSRASNLVPGDPATHGDLFLVDTAGASHTIKDITPGDDAGVEAAQVTCDGNYVIYDSDSSNLVPGDTNGYGDVFKYSIANDSTQLVSTDATGAQYSASCETSSTGCPFAENDSDPSVSMDGRYVTLAYSKEVTSGGTNHFYSSLWVKDTVTGALTEASQATNDNSVFATTTADGRQMYYLRQSASGQPNRLYVAENYL